MNPLENPYSAQNQFEKEQRLNKIRSRLEHMFNSMRIPSADVPDLAQDVAIKLITTDSQFSGENNSSFETWLYQIARNSAYDYWRKKNSSDYPDRNDSKNDGEEALKVIEDPNINFETSLENKDHLQKLINKTLASINSKRSRAVFNEGLKLLLLKEVEGLSFEEISAQTGMSENTIKVKIYRTKQKLRFTH